MCSQSRESEAVGSTDEDNGKCVRELPDQDVYWINDARNLFKLNQMLKMFAKSLEMHCWGLYAT